MSELQNMFATLPDRNNTSFAKELYETLSQIKLAKDDFLRYHQKLVVEYLMRYLTIRGLLVYHLMGSGKTLLAVAICEILMRIYPKRRIIFIANKSLHENFDATIVKYHELENMPKDKIRDYIDQHYGFVTMNASNMFEQVVAATMGEILVDELLEPELVEADALMIDEDKPKRSKRLKSQDLNLDEAIVVADEFHNLLNSIANGSKNAIRFYDAVLHARDIKLVGLTGTPIVNDPFQVALGFNMIAGPIKTSKGSTTLFGEDYADFVKNFIDNSDSLDLDSKDPKRPRIKHRDKFCDRIMGLVSYYGADTPDLIKQFPLEYDIIVKRVPMSHRQYAAYITARDRELDENKKGIFKTAAARLKKSSSDKISSYRVRSRQISNFVYPDYAVKSHRTETGKLKYETYFDKLKPESLQLPELLTYSPKFVSMLENISIHMPDHVLKEFKLPAAKLKHLLKKRTELNSNKLKSRQLTKWNPGIGPGLVYSQFLDSGVNLLARVLEIYGFKLYNGSNPNSGPSYAIISGEIPPDQRDVIVNAIKNKDNRDGSKLAILFITQTGAEGLDLQGIRHVHIMEPYWHWARIRQVITRAVRLGSHTDLPIQDQTVQPYIYLSDYPPLEQLINADDKNLLSSDLESRMKNEPTTDVTLYHKAIQNQMLIDDFLKALQDSSIDCMIHYKDKGDCRICSPTGKTLWQPDLQLDILEPSPCSIYETKKVKVQSIKINDSEYQYNKDESGKLHIFEYKPSLRAYVEIFADNDNYQLLLERIK